MSDNPGKGQGKDKEKPGQAKQTAAGDLTGLTIDEINNDPTRGKFDLNDPRVVACSEKFPDGGQEYFDCLEQSGVISKGGGG